MQEKSINIKLLLQGFFICFAGGVILQRILNLAYVLQDRQSASIIDPVHNIYMTLLVFVGIAFLATSTYWLDRSKFHYAMRAAFWSFLIAIIGGFYLDFLFILAKAVQKEAVSLSLLHSLANYFSDYWNAYVLLVLGVVGSIIMPRAFASSGYYSNAFEERPMLYYGLLYLGVILAAILFAFIPPFIASHIFMIANFEKFEALPILLAFTLNAIYVVAAAWILWKGNKLQNEHHLHGYWFLGLVGTALFITLISFVLNVWFIFYPSLHMAWDSGIYSFSAIGFAFNEVCGHAVSYIPLLILLLVGAAWFGKLRLSHAGARKGHTTGPFGRASWAMAKDLRVREAYDQKTGPIGGMDEQGKLLYFPLMNKLTIAPPSGGKTAASGIVALLTENRPMFVFDVKGELWVTTARYRAEQMGRDVILIDPYGVTSTKAFRKGKSESLLKTHSINPFDYIPEDERERDRMINSFAQSFIVTEQGHESQHFDENARTIIRGYIDYIMKTFKKDNRNLINLYELMAEELKSSKSTFSAMSELSGRAAAAANQISRVGANERGSILSTSYRQVDWIGDKNMQKTLAESSFDLRDFLKGNMDIYVVLPQEQVREHSRLMRILLSLMKYLILSADPDELPHKKMLFLLDELAQLGYCPDVEEFIEVLRSRGVVVWAVFQSNDQIELYKKPDLFRGMPMKQIFTLDDVPTMRWIQALGGKESVITQSVSKQKGHSWRESGLAAGHSSHSETASRHETGVDLIHLSDIREMPKDEQIIFIHGEKPIRCKKAFYFKHPFFAGKFDANPLERQRQ